MDAKHNQDIISLENQVNKINIVSETKVETFAGKCTVCKTVLCFLYGDDDDSISNSSTPTICGCNVRLCRGYKGKFFRYNKLIFLDVEEYDKYLEEIEDVVDYYRSLRE